MNLWKFGICPWKHPANWFRNIKQYFRNFKFMRQRIKRGWADCDVWAMNGYLADITSDMLLHLSKYSYGFPIRYYCYSDDEAARRWSEELAALAQRIDNAAGFEDDFILNSREEYDIYRNETFSMLSDVWEDLWD